MPEKNRDFKCWIGMHKYEVLSNEDLLDIKSNIVGKVIINRCVNCGKIKHNKVVTVDHHI